MDQTIFSASNNALNDAFGVSVSLDEGDMVMVAMAMAMARTVDLLKCLLVCEFINININLYI